MEGFQRPCQVPGEELALALACLEVGCGHRELGGAPPRMGQSLCFRKKFLVHCVH